jgi:hypothetical protein
VNYRDRLERSIRTSLSKGFEIEGIGFFDSMHPSGEVRESGESGWQEKPLAYVVLKATDPSIERIPPVQMDLDFIDQTGPVILAIESNSPPIDAAASSKGRPVRELAIEQIIDTRNASEEVTLEITASGRGVIGDLDDLLAGVEGAIDGYQIADDGIESHPLSMTEAAVDEGVLFRFSSSDDEEEEFAGPDEDGVHRQSTERRWTIRFVPELDATASGDFVVPVVTDGVAADLQVQVFDDMDLVKVDGGVIELKQGVRSWVWWVSGILIAMFFVLWLLLRTRTRGDGEAVDEFRDLLPSRWSPFAAVATLQRIDADYGDRLRPGRRGDLRATIGDIETKFFGPQGRADETGLETIVRAWVQEAIAAR